jgi:hypothetical protein
MHTLVLSEKCLVTLTASEGKVLKFSSNGFLRILRMNNWREEKGVGLKFK